MLAEIVVLSVLSQCAASPIISVVLTRGENATLNCTGCDGEWKFTSSTPPPPPQSLSTSNGATGSDVYTVVNATRDGYYSCGDNQCVYRVEILGPPVRNGSAELVYWCTGRDNGMSCTHTFDQCNVVGNPTPKVDSWSRYEFDSGKWTKNVITKSPDEVLDDLLVHISPKDINVVQYNCTASNDFGKVTVPVKIYIEVKPVLEGVFVSPRLSVSKKVAKEGSNVSFPVVIRGPHDTQFMWRRNNAPINALNESRYVISPPPVVEIPNEYVHSKLTILNVDEGDEGNYSCTAYTKYTTSDRAMMQLEVILKAEKPTGSSSFSLTIATLSAGLVAAAAIVLAVVWVYWRHKRPKPRNEILKCFKHDFYVSLTPSSRNSQQLSSNSASFYNNVLLSVLSESDFYCFYDPSHNRNLLGGDRYEAMTTAIAESRKLIVVVDEEEPDSEEQLAEVNAYKEAIVPLEDVREQIKPNFVVIRLGQSSTSTKDIGLNGVQSYVEEVAVEEDEKPYQEEDLRLKVEEAVVKAKRGSDFLFDVMVFYVDKDQEYAQEVCDIIRVEQPHWNVRSIYHRDPSKLGINSSSHRAAAYSRYVVAIITDEYLEEVWPHDKWMIDLKKHYLPIMRSGALLHPKSREIEKDVTYIEEDQCADDFRFNLMRSLSVAQSLPSTSSYVRIN